MKHNYVANLSKVLNTPTTLTFRTYTDFCDWFATFCANNPCDKYDYRWTNPGVATIYFWKDMPEYAAN